MELKQIEAFLKIVEKGSFSAAAEELFITQPTISVRIRQLESELKRPLFERKDGKKVMLSKYGETILPYFEDAVGSLRKSVYLLDEQLQGMDKIVVSCPNHMGAEVLPGLLKELYTNYPNIEFDVKINVTTKIVEDISDGIVHIGLGYVKDNDKWKNIQMVQVADEQTILVCGQNHPFSDQKIVPLESLKEERVIVYERDFVSTKKIEKYLQVNGLTDYKKIEISNLGWIKMMVRKGLGIAFLHKNIVKEELQNEQLVEITMGIEPPSTSIFLLFNENVNAEIKDLAIKTTKALFNT